MNTNAPTSRTSPEEVVHILRSYAQDIPDAGISRVFLSLNEAVIRIQKDSLYSFAEFLKSSSALRMNMLTSVTAVDWLDDAEDESLDGAIGDNCEEPQRFELVYHFLSMETLARLRVKVWVSEDELDIASITPLFNSANFMEREVWDMYGIKFTDHPNLVRILMYEEFKGHPLRKDYPLQGKQPRVPLISPEISNTARDMKRPHLAVSSELVNIRTKKRT